MRGYTLKGSTNNRTVSLSEFSHQARIQDFEMGGEFVVIFGVNFW